MARFTNRSAAGKALGEALAGMADAPGLIVLGLPRGGVPVAYEVARALAAPLDVFIVRKLGAPGHKELAIGALASGGIRVLNHAALADLGIDAGELARIGAEEQAEIDRRESLYRAGQPSLQLGGRTVVLVDDGLATGSTMRAAAQAVRQREPARLVVAIPVAPAPACAAQRAFADEVVCLVAAKDFFAVGEWYDDFTQTTDEEVRALLAMAR